MEYETESEHKPMPFETSPPPQPPGDGEEPGGAVPGGPIGSPRSVLARLSTRFQQSSEDLLMAKEQNTELERRITSLTEQILAANEEKETLKAEHRGALSRLEEAALAERRRYETALCAARQQQQRGQMELQLATEELAALRAQLKTLQLEKVSLARRVRDLETEVKARCRLQQDASDQMVRHNQAKHKLNKELAGLVEWLERLESECRAAGELNGRLQLLLRHQGLQLQQLAPAAAAVTRPDALCPELDQLKALLAAIGERAAAPPPTENAAAAADTGSVCDREPGYPWSGQDGAATEGGGDGPPDNAVGTGAVAPPPPVTVTGGASFS